MHDAVHNDFSPPPGLRDPLTREALQCQVGNGPILPHFHCFSTIYHLNYPKKFGTDQMKVTLLGLLDA